MIQLSTGARNLVGTDGLIAMFNGKLMYIYGAAASEAAADAVVPINANAGIGSAILLCTISVSGLGGGLLLDVTPIDGLFYKASGDVWLGTNALSGYTSFYRVQASGDPGTLDPAAVRLQGSVGILNTDVILGSRLLSIGEDQRIDSYILGIPNV